MLTQIYEISTPEEAAAISAIGVDHIGILVGDGTFPRELAIGRAKAVAAAVAAPSKVSALFLSSDLPLIEGLVRELEPEIVHLGAAAERLSPVDTRRLRQGCPGALFMRSVPVTGPEAVDVALGYEGIVDWLLLDSHKAGDTQIGALGITHDWSVSAEIARRCATPVILAGGLGPDNVDHAIRSVRPAGVDSKTKTDRAGSHAKDIDKVRAFHLAARAAIGEDD